MRVRLVMAVCLLGLPLMFLPPAAAGDKVPDYRVVPGWPRLPAGLKLGAVSGVATDASDRVYVFHRGPQPVLFFEADGNFIRSWGDAHVKKAHGLRLDAQGNVWLTDIDNHQVLKFTADGKLLLALGQKGQPGTTPDRFDKPTDIAFAADGAFYVSDGYGNSRVVKFSAEGKYVKEWGRKGKGAGEFDLPHAIVVHAGKVYVGDRENARVQVFDGDGKFLAKWDETGYPFGLALTPEKRMLIADGRADWVKLVDLDGKTLGRFGAKGKGPGQLDLPHGICTDSRGNVYVTEITGQRVQKFVPK